MVELYNLMKKFLCAFTAPCGEHLEWGGWGASGLITPYPNPFSNGVTSPFLAGPQGSDVQIEMIDIMGKTVKSLANGHFGSGLQTVQWAANDASGNRVAPGAILMSV